MKASELRKTIEDKTELKDEVNIETNSNFSDESNQISHNSILGSYLDNVGYISKSINEELKKIDKKNDSSQV